jgi:hypothetical protein
VTHPACANAQRGGVVRLTALIDALPEERTIGIPTTIAADLVLLLPRGNSLNVRSSVSVFAPAGRRQARILMVLSALAIMTLIVFAISAVIPVGPGIAPPPREYDATTGYAAPIKTGSELLGRLEQTEDRIPVALIEKADRSPDGSPIPARI